MKLPQVCVALLSSVRRVIPAQCCHQADNQKITLLKMKERLSETYICHEFLTKKTPCFSLDHKLTVYFNESNLAFVSLCRQSSRLRCESQDLRCQSETLSNRKERQSKGFNHTAWSYNHVNYTHIQAHCTNTLHCSLERCHDDGDAESGGERATLCDLWKSAGSSGEVIELSC